MIYDDLRLEEKLNTVITLNFKKTNCTLDRELKGKQVLIYGCGNMGYLTWSKIYTISNVVGIIDQAGENAKYYKAAHSLGVPVFRLGEEPENIQKQKEDIIVLVAVCMKYKQYQEFRVFLRENGYKNIFYSRMYSYEQVYKDSVPEIEKGFSLLCDIKSKELYLELLSTGGGYNEFVE